MDLKVYCPTNFLLRPGPLFGDVDSISDAFYAKIESTILEGQRSKLCRICGFPNCACPCCKWWATRSEKVASGKLSTNSKPPSGHSCLLPRLPGARSAKGPRYTDAQRAEFALAWHELGILQLPTWKAAEGAYSF